MHVLAHDELKRADERSLQRRDVHFAVTLSGVAVADFKERARRVHRKYRVVPATRSLLSRFPPIIHGGALLKRPAPSGGASPMLPKKGCSGISMPGANFAIMRCASSGIIFIFA